MQAKITIPIIQCLEIQTSPVYKLYESANVSAYIYIVYGWRACIALFLDQFFSLKGVVYVDFEVFAFV